MSHPEIVSHQRVDHLFTQRLNRWPDRIAIQFGERQITYRELDRRSTILAHRLVGHGVRRGDIVALAVGDIEQFALASLAILKSGAAYLAMDTRYPVERSRDILIDARPVLLLAVADFPAKFIPPGLTVLNDFTAPTPADSDQPIQLEASADDAACICYTSGSTGRPKGIVVPHRGIPYLIGDRDLLPFVPDDRIGQASNFAFDAVTFEVWGGLLNGACVVHVPKEVLFSITVLRDYLVQYQISILWLTTSFFNALATRRPDGFGTLKSLIIGGEAADPAPIGRVLRSDSPPRRLVNAYGPTEGTTFATWHEVTLADVDAGQIPIGRPVWNMQVHVLNEQLAPVAEGEPGELFIGGPGVATGYLHQPQMTTERFIPNPLSQNPDDRLYRTGDLCCVLPNGEFGYLGRMDDQVKIRGFRVEPADVATSLRKLAAVDDAVVIARNASFGTKELVAFIRTTQIRSSELFRQELAQHLPEYMVPTMIACVNEFPLTANGKLDRAKLLAGIHAGVSVPTPTTPTKPGDAIEPAIAAIWKNVLRREEIAPDVDFYALGGDSLSVMNLALEIEDQFSIVLTIDELPKPMTIPRLAELVRRHDGKLKAADAPVVNDDGSPVPAVFAISYPWAMGRMPEEIGRALSPRGHWRHIQMPNTYFRSATHVTIEDIAVLVEQAIRAQSADGPYILFGFCFPGLVAYEVAQRLLAAGKQVTAVVMADSFPMLPQTLPRRTLSLALRSVRFVKNRLWAMLPQWPRGSHQKPAKGPGSGKKAAAKAGAGANSSYEEFVRQACFRATVEYQPRPYPGRVIFFHPAQTPFVDPFIGRDFKCWQRLIRGTLTERTIELHDACNVSDDSVQSGYQELADHLKTMKLW